MLKINTFIVFILYNFITMPKVPKEYVKSFLLQANVLLQDEIDLITPFCEFEIEMPSSENNQVILYIDSEKVLPTRIYNKLVNFPNKTLKVVIKSDNLSDDYSRLDEYIQV